MDSCDNKQAVRATTANANEDKSGASLCHQVAAWVPDMFRYFNLVKNHEISNNSTTIEAREKNNTDLKI
jgi:hypothetical protein